jgi:hypothetical protein
MTMAPAVRKLALTAHVTSSVGWFGAVAGFLALAVTGLASHEAHRVQAAYLAMESLAWLVIVPLSLGSLVTGVVQALGTHWGLFRHYWVLIKLLMTVLATAFLLLHLQPISWMSGVNAAAILSSAEAREVRVQLAIDAGAALLVLLVATTLSVYKPRGQTPYRLAPRPPA